MGSWSAWPGCTAQGENQACLHSVQVLRLQNRAATFVCAQYRLKVRSPAALLIDSCCGVSREWLVGPCPGQVSWTATGGSASSDEQHTAHLRRRRRVDAHTNVLGAVYVSSSGRTACSRCYCDSLQQEAGLQQSCFRRQQRLQPSIAA